MKHILIVTDYPTDMEEDRNSPYSSPLHQQMLESLRKESLALEIPANESLHYKNLEAVYLSDKRPNKDDPDWLNSIVSKKQLPEGQSENYVEVPWLKDVWVTKTLYESLTKLLQKIEEVNPSIIVCGGKWSFLFLTGLSTIASTKSTQKKKQIFGGLAKFRGSTLQNKELLGDRIIFPIYTPKEYWAWKDKEQVVKGDYAKIARLYKSVLEGNKVSELVREPSLHFYTDKSPILLALSKLYNTLEKRPTLVATDVETRAGQIDCIGFCWDARYTLTIPFTKVIVRTLESPETITKKTSDGSIDYLAEAGTVVSQQVSVFSVEEETEIMYWLSKCMLHKNYLHVGQNYSYDCQYYYRNWKQLIFPYHDTMILHHVLYNNMEKNLAFLASMYVEGYKYWKDEIDVTVKKDEQGNYLVNNEDRWKYNGKDNYYTLEIVKKLFCMLEQRSPALQDFYNFQIAEIAPAMVAVMQKGVRIDVQQKSEQYKLFAELLSKIETMFNEILGQEINLKSSQQVKSLFKDLLEVEPELNKKTKTESFGAAAMLVYAEKYPLYNPLFKLLLEYKSIGVFVRNFLSMPLDVDQRMRCSYNVAGTDTYRFASRKNAFGTGGNLQNLPSKGKIDIRYALQELSSDEDIIDIDSSVDSVEGIMKLPNVKKIFLPDIGYVFFDMDYSSADAQFVAWDSDCEFLKKIFKAKEDLYSIVASHYYQREIVKKDKERQIFKQVCHATHYKGKAGMIASLTGLSVGLVMQVQDWYLKQCPEVKEWHHNVESLVRSGNPVSNIWGAEGWFTDFNDHNLINKAVAWIPQSSVGILVNKGIVRMLKGEYQRLDSTLDTKDIRSLLTDACNKKIDCPTSVLGQTHDSAWGQYDEKDLDAPTRLVGYMELDIPYKDKLIIPAGIKTSNVSYGDC